MVWAGSRHGMDRGQEPFVRLSAKAEEGEAADAILLG